MAENMSIEAGSGGACVSSMLAFVAVWAQEIVDVPSHSLALGAKEMAVDIIFSSAWLRITREYA